MFCKSRHVPEEQLCLAVILNTKIKNEFENCCWHLKASCYLLYVNDIMLILFCAPMKPQGQHVSRDQSALCLWPLHLLLSQIGKFKFLFKKKTILLLVCYAFRIQISLLGVI